MDASIVYLLIGAALSSIGFFYRTASEKAQTANELLYYLLNLWYLTRTLSELLSSKFEDRLIQTAEKRWGKQAALMFRSDESKQMLSRMRLESISKVYIEPIKAVDARFTSLISTFSRYYPVLSFELYGNSDVPRMIEFYQALSDELLETKLQEETALDPEATRAQQNTSGPINESDRPHAEAVHTEVPADVRVDELELVEIMKGKMSLENAKELESDLRALSWKAGFLTWFNIRRKIAKVNSSFDEGADQFAARYFELIEQAFTEFMVQNQTIEVSADLSPRHSKQPT